MPQEIESHRGLLMLKVWWITLMAYRFPNSDSPRKRPSGQGGTWRVFFLFHAMSADKKETHGLK